MEQLATCQLVQIIPTEWEWFELIVKWIDYNYK